VLPLLLQTLILFMTVKEQIKAYMASQPEPKSNELQELHNIILTNAKM
jgi:hypothetical protein